jgi:hypothetical protein
MPKLYPILKLPRRKKERKKEKEKERKKEN